MTQGEQEEEGRKNPSVTKKGSPFLEVKESQKKTWILFLIQVLTTVGSNVGHDDDDQKQKWGRSFLLSLLPNFFFLYCRSSFQSNTAWSWMSYWWRTWHDRVKSSFQYKFPSSVLSHVISNNQEKKVKHNFRLNASKLTLVFFGFFC